MSKKVDYLHFIPSSDGTYAFFRMHQYENKQALLAVFCSSVPNATSISCRNCIIFMMKKNLRLFEICFSKNEEKSENFADLK